MTLDRKKELYSLLRSGNVEELNRVIVSGDKEDLAYLYKNKKQTSVNLYELFIVNNLFLENIFYHAVCAEDLPLATKVLNKGFDPDYLNGWAIVKATLKNNLPLMQLLVQYGADIHACDALPLRISQMKKQYEMISFLMNKGAGNFVMQVRMSTVGSLLGADYRPYRGGVIPYFFYNNKPIFMMGVDRRYGELTDFGGKICYKKDKNFLQGSLRELKEESLGILDYTESDIQKYSPVLHSGNTAITFLLIDEYFEFRKDFRDIVDSKSELCDVFFVSMQDLMKLRKGIIINRGTYYGEKKQYRSYKLYDLVKSVLNTDAFYQLEDFINGVVS